MKCSQEAAETNFIQECVRVGFTLCKTSLDFRLLALCSSWSFWGFLLVFLNSTCLETYGGKLLCIVGDVVYSQLTLIKPRRL